jgi:hypothetical protein
MELKEERSINVGFFSKGDKKIHAFVRGRDDIHL